MDSECQNHLSDMAMHVLLSVTCNTNYFNTIETEAGRSNAAQAWRKLCARLDPQVQVDADLTRREIENMEQVAGSDVDHYIAELDRMFAKLEVLGYEVTEEQRLNKLIDSVSSEFREVCSRIREERMYDKTRVSYDAACSRLRTYQWYDERRPAERNRGSNKAFPAEVDHQRRPAQSHNGRQRPNGTDSGRGRRQKGNRGKPRYKDRRHNDDSSYLDDRHPNKDVNDHSEGSHDESNENPRRHGRERNQRRRHEGRRRNDRPIGRDPFQLNVSEIRDQGLPHAVEMAEQKPLAVSSRQRAAKELYPSNDFRLSGALALHVIPNDEQDEEDSIMSESDDLFSSSEDSDDFRDDSDPEDEDIPAFWDPFTHDSGIWENVPLSARFQRGEQHQPIAIDGIPIEIRPWGLVLADGRPLGAELFVYAQLIQASMYPRSGWTGLTAPLRQQLLQPEEIIGLFCQDGRPATPMPRGAFVVDLDRVPRNWTADLFLRVMESLAGPLRPGFDYVGRSIHDRIFGNDRGPLGMDPITGRFHGMLQITALTRTGTKRVTFGVPGFRTSAIGVSLSSDIFIGRAVVERDMRLDDRLFHPASNNLIDYYFPGVNPDSHESHNITELLRSDVCDDFESRQPTLNVLRGSTRPTSGLTDGPMEEVKGDDSHHARDMSQPSTTRTASQRPRIQSQKIGEPMQKARRRARKSSRLPGDITNANDTPSEPRAVYLPNRIEALDTDTPISDPRYVTRSHARERSGDEHEPAPRRDSHPVTLHQSTAPAEPLTDCATNMYVQPGDPATDWTIALVDSGASQSIICHSGPFIGCRQVGPWQVVGINQTSMVSTLVTAELVTITSNGEEIILTCGDMMLLPSATTTLLSLSQLQAAGHLVRTKHKPSILLEGGESVPLDTSDGLFKLKFRFPTYEEHQNLPKVDLTWANFNHIQCSTLCPSSLEDPASTIDGWRARLMFPGDETLQRTLDNAQTETPAFRRISDLTSPSQLKSRPHKGSLTSPQKPDRLIFPEIVDTDTFFSNTTTTTGEKCAQIFVERKTMTTLVIPMRTKSCAGHALESWIQIFAVPQHIHSDNAGELTSGLFHDICRRNGIKRSFSTPHTPQQNGVAERHIGIIKRMANAALEYAGLPPRFWAFACTQASFIANLLCKKRLGWRSPHEARTNLRANISHVHVFGCLVHVKLEDPPSFGPATWVGLYLGNSTQYPLDTATILNPKTSRVVQRRDVAYFDHHLPCRQFSEDWLTPQWHDHRHTSGGEYRTPRHPPLLPFEGESPTQPSLSQQDENLTEHITPTGELSAESIPYDPNDSSHTLSGFEWNDDEEDDHKQSETIESFNGDTTTDWIGTKIYRVFKAPGTNTNYEYEGVVIDTRNDRSLGRLFRIRYSDGDEEELDTQEVQSSLQPQQPASHIINGDVDQQNILPDSVKRERKTVRFTVPTHAISAANKRKFKEGYLIPKTHAQAMRTPEAEQWRAAELKELHAMRDLKVFEEVDFLPEGAKALPLMILYDVKSDLRFKVRMVARGDLQDPDTYFESYSPVVRISSIRFLLTMSAQYGLEIFSTDISTAYLNADIDADIYFRAPDFFPHPGALLRARKAIYGLKQAGVCWFLELEEKLESMGFERTIVDKCIWGKATQSGPIFIATYVDDLLIIGSHTSVQHTLGELKAYYTCRDDGPLHSFLGMDFLRLNHGPNPGYQINMAAYVTKLITRHGRTGRNALKLYTTPGTKNTMHGDDDLLPAESKTLYQSLVGAFQWLSTCMRPDITFATNYLAKKSNEPREGDLRNAWRVLGYLERTASQGLSMGHGTLVHPTSSRVPSRELFQKKIDGIANSETKENLDNEEVDTMETLLLDSMDSLAPRLRDQICRIARPMVITAFADADFAGDTDAKKSTTGYVIYLNSSPIAWTSKRIKCAVTSTFEAEFIALSEVLKETLYLVQLSGSLGITLETPITIYCDNLSAAYVASNLDSEAKARHVAIRFHHVRSYVECGMIRVIHCDSEDMHADIFTKFLPKAQHYALMGKIMGQE